MKKTVKAKLTLDRTTIRVLATNDLRDVVGGTTGSCAGTCNSCPLAPITCTCTLGCPMSP